MRSVLLVAIIITGALGQSAAAAPGPAQCAQTTLQIQDAPGSTRHAVAADAAGNIYAGVLQEVRRYDAAGTQTSSIPSTSATPPFGVPASVAVDPAGNVYLTDTNTDVTYRFDPSGVQTLAIPSEGDNPAPEDVAADAAGNIYIADGNNGTVERFDASGARTLQLVGTPGFNLPASVDVDTAGNIYVADYAANRDSIYRFDASGNQTLFIGPNDFTPPVNGGVGFGHGVRRVAVDPAGNIYVGVANSGIFRFDPTGAQTFFIPRTVTSPRLRTFDLDVDLAANLYVSPGASMVDRLTIGPRPSPADVSLEVGLSATPTTVDQGGTARFTVTVSNAGPCDALAVEVGVGLPAGFVVDAIDAEPGTSYDQTGGTWSLPTVLDDRQDLSLRITGRLDEPGLATTTAVLTSDPRLDTDVDGDDTASASVQVVGEPPPTTTTTTTAPTTTTVPTTTTTSPPPPSGPGVGGPPAVPVLVAPRFTG